jgi:hypothetical protein
MENAPMLSGLNSALKASFLANEAIKAQFDESLLQFSHVSDRLFRRDYEIVNRRAQLSRRDAHIQVQN